MERLEGLDEEFQKEETEKVTSIEEAKKKRPPFHYWEVAGVQHKMKLNTGMITKLENKYRTNILTLVTANDIPPLGVMLTIAQAAIEPWEHGTTFDKVTKLYDKWLEEGGNQFNFMAKVIMPTMAVSGFFTPAMAEHYLGLEVEERDVYLDEVKEFAECGLCGTAAVISPVGKIVDHGKEICFPSGMEKMGPTIQKLYDTLTGIQMGHIEAPEGWIQVIE